MARKVTRTDRTEAGVRLVVIENHDRGRVRFREFRVQSLRAVPIQYFMDRTAADSAFDAEVTASRADPKLGPIIN